MEDEDKTEIALAILLWKDFRSEGVGAGGSKQAAAAHNNLRVADRAVELARRTGVLPEFLGLLAAVPLYEIEIRDADGGPAPRRPAPRRPARPKKDRAHPPSATGRAGPGDGGRGMRLTLLEARDVPAAAAGGGLVDFGSGPVRPFEDWAGHVEVLDAGDRVYVGAGPGGGPRVAVFDAAGGRVRGDYFAGDPGSRAGVVFVRPGPAAAPVLTFGGPVRPDAWTVFLDFEGPASYDEAYVREAAELTAKLLAPAGVVVTTARPDLPPGGYGTVVVGAPLGWAAAAGGPVPLGVAADTWGRPADAFEARAVYVRDGLAAPTAARTAAHEAAHALGLPHADRPGNLMAARATGGTRLDPDQVTVLRETAARAASPGR